MRYGLGKMRLLKFEDINDQDNPAIKLFIYIYISKRKV